jgi:TonB-linked SusC/RagA family outer membrane protein
MLITGFTILPVKAQSVRMINGAVVSGGEPLIGASISEKGTTNGTVTDVDGRFSLQVKPQAQLIVSYIGYKTKTVATGNQSSLQIELEEDSHVLNEVVAIGYGVQQKKLVTGATLQVKGDDIAKLNTISAMSALQSQAPGVNIVKSSGKPDAAFKVIIRGLGTIHNSNPLYVVDGVLAGDNDDVINNMNPADIESIDVLKDAASAAIYGSRSANGVILITTKQGKKGKASIQYDGYMGWQNIYKKLTPLNAQQYMDIYNEAAGYDLADPNRYDRFTSTMSPADRGKFLAGTWNGTDWLNEMINENAPITNHSLNITGGTDASTYSIGLAYTAQSPLIGISNEELDPKYERYNVRINTEHKLIKNKDLDILKLGQTLQLIYKNSKSITMATDHADWNDIHSALTANPLYSVYDEEGNFALSKWNSQEDNPIARMYYNSFSQGKNYSARGSFYFVIQPIKNLTNKTTLGYSFSGWQSRSFVPVYELNHTKHNYTQVSQSSDQGLDWTLDNTLSYDFHLMDKHHLSAMLGVYASRSGLGDHVGATTIDLQWDDFKHAYIANGVTTGTDSRVKVEGSPWSWRDSKLSYFGRLNYDYQGTYMATFIYRRDGSSKFAEGHRWGTFPSVSAGWILSNEAFMESTASWLDFFKIRGGWGENGNDAIPTFRYLANVNFTKGATGYAFDADKSATSLGAYFSNVPNASLIWETSRQIDIGFDSWLFRNKLGVNFDYYVKNTVDWLDNPAVLATWGTGAPYINGGEVQNKGIETQLTWQGQRHDFKYSVSANITYNQNEVIDIANDLGYTNGPTGAFGQNSEVIYRAEEGYPMGFFYGYKTDGIIQTQEEAEAYDKNHSIFISDKKVVSQPGDVKYVDVFPDGIIDAKDKTMIGNPHPDVYYGLTINLAWKGFDFSINGSGVAGNQIARSYRSWQTQSYENYTTDILARWTGEGTSNSIPRLAPDSRERNWLKFSDCVFLEDGDYFRINNFTLGYDFKQLFRNSPVLSQLRIYGAIQNLVTFTNYSGMDPDLGADGSSSSVAWARGVDIGNYPSARTYLVGLSIKY